MKMMRLIKSMGMSLVMILAMAANVFGMEETKHVKKVKTVRHETHKIERPEVKKARPKKTKGIKSKIAQSGDTVRLNLLKLKSLDPYKKLLVAHNKETPITILDLSFNNLEIVTIPEELTSLEDLDISNNEKLKELTIIIPGLKLDKLDLSQTPALQQLKISEGLLSPSQIQKIHKEYPDIIIKIVE